jgi:hypothetical protein
MALGQTLLCVCVCVCVYLGTNVSWSLALIEAKAGAGTMVRPGLFARFPNIGKRVGRGRAWEPSGPHPPRLPAKPVSGSHSTVREEPWPGVTHPGLSSVSY